MGLLRHKGTKSAPARIVDVDRSMWTADSSAHGGGGRSFEAKVRLRVMPEGHPEFDSQARVWGMDAVQQLFPGRDTYVLYDPEHTSRCDIDRERLRAEFGPARNGKDRVVTLDNAQARFEETLTELERDPAAFVEHRREAQARAAQSQAQAIAAAVQGAGAAEDPADSLQKLADLHDRGALTDAEFAAAKAKILNKM